MQLTRSKTWCIYRIIFYLHFLLTLLRGFISSVENITVIKLVSRRLI